jgi:hypothetical protein
MRYARSVATRSDQGTPKQLKAGKRSAKGSALGKSPKRLAGSKKSPERRTTLRVPRALQAEIAEVARELEISPNQALVHLAALGAENAHREREVRRVMERRRAAIMKPGATAAAFPSPEEMRAAILVDRN